MTTSSLCETLDQWLQARLPLPAWDWVQQHCEQIGEKQAQSLALGFGLTSRKVPRQELNLTTEELRQAEQSRPGWQPGHWSLPDAVRIRLILAWPLDSETEFVQQLDRLFNAGEVHELIALYQGLPVYPFPEAHRLRAAEGIRTNMGAVFKAVAQRNIYSSEQLPENMWNQMILKCLFVGIRLHPVVGLEARNNAELSRMLSDYAHERWAASRDVAWDLWRCVEPAFYPLALDDLKRVLETGTPTEQAAAALSLSASQSPAAGELLARYPEWNNAAQSGQLRWKDLA